MIIAAGRKRPWPVRGSVLASWARASRGAETQAEPAVGSGWWDDGCAAGWWEDSRDPAASWPSRSRSTQSGPVVASRPHSKLSGKNVYIIGDSFLRGLQKVFHYDDDKKGWEVDERDGKEALHVDLQKEGTPVEDFDYVFYVSSGNALWHAGWDQIALENILAMDPDKVSGVVLLGDAELWLEKLGGDFKGSMTFFEDVKQALNERGIAYLESRGDFLQNLPAADAEGHPTKQARWDLGPHLATLFEKLAAE